MHKFAAASVFAAMMCGWASAQRTDECSMYSDSCVDCLNVTNPDGQGHRNNCGWCNGGVTYHDGSHGPACIDTRDKGPDGKGWKCLNSQYENYFCPYFWDCNHTSGKCYQDSTRGRGTYDNKTVCDMSCYPGPKPKQLYKCNVSNPKQYTCDKCPENSTEHCMEQSEACRLCKAPPPRKYKCNMTQSPPQCAACLGNDTAGCGDEATACKQCNHHNNPNQTRYTCNMTTFKCEKSNHSSSGFPKSACNSSCSNSTPSDLQNTIWRGIEVERGYKKGEFDLEFKKQTFEMKGPDGFSLSGTVSTDFEGKTLNITKASQQGMSGHFLRFNKRDVDERAPETLISAFMFGALDGEAPQSLSQAMAGQPAGSKVYLMARCKSSGGNGTDKKCDFSPVFPPVANLPIADDDNLVLKVLGDAQEKLEDAPVSSDPCNIYTTCEKCISSTVPNFKCGWCIGATVNYNSSSMPTGMKCAGTPTNGSSNPFICPKRFSTENCEAYQCQWGKTPPTCAADQTGEGYATKAECEQEGQCNATKNLQKCDWKSRKCVKCQQGEPGCDTSAHCAASGCNNTKKQFAKCNVKTKQCTQCTPTKDHDPNCTMDKEQCGKMCSKTAFGICDPDTGKCKPCDNSTNQTGCVNGCQDTCKKHPHPSTEKAICNYTSYQCTKSNESWAPSKEECEKNCKPVAFAKCNTTTGKCDTCKQGTPGCQYTKAQCNTTCKKQNPLNGVFRGIEISKGFHVGEWDFDFSQQNNCKITFTPNDQSSNPQVFAATPTPGTPTAGGVTSIQLKFTTAPANNYLNVQSGDTLNGIYKMDDGQYKIFEVLHLATANGSNKPAPASFDAAMTSGFVFDLYACKQSSSGTCDFQPTLVRAGEANQWVPAADESNPWAEGGAYSMRIN